MLPPENDHLSPFSAESSPVSEFSLPMIYRPSPEAPSDPSLFPGHCGNDPLSLSGRDGNDPSPFPEPNGNDPSPLPEPNGNDPSASSGRDGNDPFSLPEPNEKPSGIFEGRKLPSEEEESACTVCSGTNMTNAASASSASINSTSRSDHITFFAFIILDPFLIRRSAAHRSAPYGRLYLRDTNQI